MTPLFGYAGEILRVDLSSGRIDTISTRDYAGIFMGGMGIAAKLYWEEVSPDIKALDPENPLIIVTGPLGGFTGLAGSMWQVHGKSPLASPESFTYGNLGGTWGAHLKFAGYDGIVIRGKAGKPVYLYVDNDTVEIRDASQIWGTDTTAVRQLLKKKYGTKAKVAAIGPAGENLVLFANIIADYDSSASAGMGAVMGSKNLKALVVKGDRRPIASDPERVRRIAGRLRKLKEGAREPDFGLIPGPNARRQLCFGCISGCHRTTAAARGDRGKFMCQSGIFYQYRAQRYYGEWNEVPYLANRLCDRYGMDTRVMETMLAWLSRCQLAGVLTDDFTGLPLSRLGSLEFIEAMVQKICNREGFGDILARGTMGAAGTLGGEARKLITDYVLHPTGQSFDSDPRVDVMTGLLYAMQPREHAVVSELAGAVGKWREWHGGVKDAYVTHDVLRAISKKFVGDESAVDFSVDEGKGRAVKIIQDRWSARESLILCAFTWPITDTAAPGDHLGDSTLENQLYSAVTGNEMDEAVLNRAGEVIFNLRRAIFAREGRAGRDSETLPDIFYSRPYKSRISPQSEAIMPGREGETVSRKGAVIERDRFEALKDEYYRARRWEVGSGLQKKDLLLELGLGDVAEDLEKRGLVSR